MSMSLDLLARLKQLYEASPGIMWDFSPSVFGRMSLRDGSSEDSIQDSQIAYLKEFKTYGAMVSTAEKGPYSSEKIKSAVFGDSGFGGCSFETAIKKAWFGDRQILEDIRVRRDRIIAELKDVTFVQDWQYSESGTAVDIGKFVTGEPDCMFDVLPSERKAITIAVNVSYSGGTDHASIVSAGAAIYIIAEWFHRNRYNVRILGEEVCQGRDDKYCIHTYPIKDFHQPFDTGRIAFTFAHPAFLRRVVFGLNDSTPDSIREEFGFMEGGGYGRASSRVYSQGQIKLSMSSLSSENGGFIGNSVKFIQETISKKYD